MILIYQMGKVASTTIYENIKRHTFGSDKNDVIHVHYICKKVGNYNDNLSKRIISYKTEVIKKNREKIKIITLIRNPVDRNISAFLQHFKSFIKNETDIKNIHNIFIDQYSHNVPELWFDTEFKIFTGIDVYEYTFDAEIGYQKYSNDQFDILLVRVEDLKRCYDVIFDFINIDVCTNQIKNFNVGSTKKYLSKYTYDELKSMVKEGLTDKYIQDIKNTKYYKHFYGN